MAFSVATAPAPRPAAGPAAAGAWAPVLGSGRMVAVVSGFHGSRLLRSLTSTASPCRELLSRRPANGGGSGPYKNNLLVRATVADVATKSQTTLPRGESWSVHKFGGTCVGTHERIAHVADLVVEDASLRKVVVVSAMSKVTDMMYELLKKAESQEEVYQAALDAVYEKHKSTAVSLLGGGEDLERFLVNLRKGIDKIRSVLEAINVAGYASEQYSDFVVGHGELWSAELLAAAVRKRGLPCVWMDAREVLVVNLTRSNTVDPDYERSSQNLDLWYASSPSDTIIVTGFIATTPDKDSGKYIPTTLKRDGSDFSAAIMGALFKAGHITIWTDVDGVYSADPRKVKEAVVLSALSYQEAWEMSYFGANVLHPRTTIPAMKYNIPITIRNAFKPTVPGTKISHGSTESVGQPEILTFKSMDSVVKGFATIDNVALINVEGTGMAGVPGTASEIFDVVKGVGANVIMISQASSEHSVCFAVPEKEGKSVAEALERRFQRALSVGRLSNVGVLYSCSILAAVGQRMASTRGVSATLFGALAKANINVRAIAQGCSEYNITVVVDRDDSVRALKAVHARFFLSKTPLAVGIVGKGQIGSALLGQLRDQASSLKEEFNIDLRVMGIMGSKTMLLDSSGINLSRWNELMEENGEAADMTKFTAHVQRQHSIPNTVIVDCTPPDPKAAGNYYNWLRNGIHVITCNKSANSGPLNQYLMLRELQWESDTPESYIHYFYEATVGAGLPIISTLRGLLETGDVIERVEGIFSGTLSYIFNNFEDGKAFSAIVLDAKSAGYTEPDPRDDLSGTDVARKVVILARECGLTLELSDIKVQSLVPEALQGQSVSSSQEYLAKLPSYDADMQALAAEANADGGKVLRYVGVVDVVAGEGRVELGRYPRNHPFAQLNGTDNIIQFTTKRYQKQPLIVRGPGAGAEVTAGGVFCDMLRLASYLGAPSCSAKQRSLRT